MVTEDGGNIEYVWEESYEEFIESETYMPYIWSFLPKVSIVPIHFEYEKEGSFESWNSFGE